MRIVVYPHSMHPGGSQANAIDVATTLKQRGHEVLVFSPAGPLVDLVVARGLRHVPAPRPRMRPSFAVIRSLNRVVSEFRPDVVHAFEWPPTVEAAFGPLLVKSIPVVGTIMSMAVAPFIPTVVPITVGTRSILEVERHRRPVSLLVPPVDTTRDAPRDKAQSRAELGIDEGDLVVSLVCRLAPELKLEGVLSAIDAVGTLGRNYPVRLVIAGDGPARVEVETAAALANAATGTETIRLTGHLDDPGPLYDAADVALGMGGSALRSMAYGKPLVVQGERGFWKLLEPASLAGFERTGWFGIGDDQDGTAALERILGPLLADATLRWELGAFARQVVVSGYGLDAVTDRVEELYRAAIRSNQAKARSKVGLLPPYFAVLGYDLSRKIRRRLGGVPSDDFNTISRMQPTLRGNTS